MYRFVLSRRWIAFGLFVVLLGGVCVRLGVWQWHRHDERVATSARIKSQLDDAPRPLDQVVPPTADDVPDGAEYVPVRVSGTYDLEHQVTVKYQTRDGSPGVDVVTPLVTADGRAVLVDRGWMETANTSGRVEDLPGAPSGTVEVTGWVRPDNGADDAAVVPDDDDQVRAISSDGIGAGLDYPVYPGYLNLLEQQPAADGALAVEPDPDVSQGPHFFYALQWWFFAALAVFGFFFFAWSEAHPKLRRPPQDDDAPTGSGSDPDGSLAEANWVR